MQNVLYPIPPNMTPVHKLLLWHSMLLFTNQNCSTWRLRFHLKLCSFEGFSTLWVLVFSKHSDFIFPLSQSQSWLQPSVLSCCCLPVPRWSCPTLLPIKELVTYQKKLFHIRAKKIQETGHKGTKTMKWVTTAIPPRNLANVRADKPSWKKWKWKLGTEWKPLYYGSGFYESPPGTTHTSSCSSGKPPHQKTRQV